MKGNLHKIDVAQDTVMKGNMHRVGGHEGKPAQRKKKYQAVPKKYQAVPKFDLGTAWYWKYQAVPRPGPKIPKGS